TAEESASINPDKGVRGYRIVVSLGMPFFVLRRGHMFEARKLYGLLFILLLLATSAFGQEFTGTINGRVTDASGAVIPGVNISLTSNAIQGTRAAISGETGAYQFVLLPAGTYNLKFELPGFKTINHEGVIVQVQKTTTINEAMAVAATAETVTVTGESPVVD